MPINNTYFGVWKALSVYSPKNLTSALYIVEDATEKTNQDIRPMQYVQGTALPRVLQISGGIGEFSITAPLLVKETARTSLTEIADGLSLWDALFNATMVSGTFTADPGFILDSASFVVDADQGAKYTLNMKGDADALFSEVGAGGTEWFRLNDSGDPFGDDVPFRVAQFYDIQASIGSPAITGLVKKLQFDVDFELDDFAYIGQDDQRKILGVKGASIKFSGTMISSTRTPTGDDFGWQDLDVYGNQGGRATRVTGGIDVSLRQATFSPNNLLPGIDLSSVVFDKTSVKIGPGLIESDFSGQVWFTSQTL